MARLRDESGGFHVGERVWVKEFMSAPRPGTIKRIVSTVIGTTFVVEWDEKRLGHDTVEVAHANLRKWDKMK